MRASLAEIIAIKKRVKESKITTGVAREEAHVDLMKRDKKKSKE